MDVKSLLVNLEAELQRVAETGARHLSIAPAPDAPTFHEAQALSLDQSDVTRPAESSPNIRAASSDTAPIATVASPRSALELGTLEALKFEFRDCMACRLGSTRKRLVFGTGSTRPRILFIGEGPGAEEDEQGLPFVGRAGALLTGFIRALGLTREDVYITNVVKCRPPGNRNPEPDEIASCRPILRQQIALLDPGLIVVLGNVPLKTLNAQAGGITRERGRTFQYERWTVLPTFHPSYLLRSPGAIPQCWMDFRTAFRMTYPDARI
jgi:uracil-DNA glycosylase